MFTIVGNRGQRVPQQGFQLPQLTRAQLIRSNHCDRSNWNSSASTAAPPGTGSAGHAMPHGALNLPEDRSANSFTGD